MKLIKKTAGGVGEYTWDQADTAIEVADDLALELLALDPSEFSVPAEKAAPAKKAAAKKPAAEPADA